MLTKKNLNLNSMKYSDKQTDKQTESISFFGHPIDEWKQNKMAISNKQMWTVDIEIQWQFTFKKKFFFFWLLKPETKLQIIIIILFVDFTSFLLFSNSGEKKIFNQSWLIDWLIGNKKTRWWQ